MAKYNLRINGNAQSVDSSDADKPLLYVLRELKLTATKFGCGLGQCGACTVLINGAAARSCQTSVADAQGKPIVTLEGLAAGQPASTADRLHQRAGAAVRLLYQRYDHERGRSPVRKQKAERSRYSLGARRQSLPLRVSRAGCARGHGGVRTARLTRRIDKIPADDRSI